MGYRSPSQPQQILAIDIGTTSVRAACISATLEISAIAARPLNLRTLQEGRVEQDGNAILDAVKQVIDQTLEHRNVQPQCAALAIQRSTVIAWDRQTGAPRSAALSWQDVRTRAIVDSLQQHRNTITGLSGLAVSAHYGASKIAWLREQVSEQSCYIAPLVSFILYHLLEMQPFVCDESNACRTQLYDIQQRCWSPVLGDLFDVPIAELPHVKPTCYNYGLLQKVQIPLVSVCGDQNAAFLALRRPNSAVANLGTGAFLLAESAHHHPGSPLLQGITCSTPEQSLRVMEGTVNGAGAALDWCHQQWCEQHDQAPSRESFYQSLPKWLATIHQPPLFINTIGNLGSPWWQPQIAPQFGNESGQAPDWPARAVAVLESISFLLYANLCELNTFNKSLTIEHIQCAGGLTQIEGFLQRLANSLEIPVAVCEHSEATLLGLAISCGFENTLTFNTVTPKYDADLLKRRDTFMEVIRQKVNSLERNSEIAP